MAEKRWQIGHELGRDKAQSHSDIIQEILDLCGGAPFESNGVLKVFVPRPKTPVAHLNRENFEVLGATNSDITSIPNIVEVEYEPSNGQAEKRVVTWEDPERIEDWREVRKTVSKPGIPTKTQASRDARMMGRRSFAERLNIRGIAKHGLITLEPGDVVSLTYGHADSQWFNNKLFWVDQITPEDSNGDVELQLIEYGGDTIFDDGLSNIVETNDPILLPDPSNALPSPDSVPLGVTEAAYRFGVLDRKPTKLFCVDIRWSRPSQPEYMMDKWVIFRRISPDGDWAAVDEVSGRQSSWRDMDVQPHITAYDYLVRAKTKTGSLSTRPSAGYDVRTVNLSLDAPPPPTNLRVTTLLDSRNEIAWDYNNPPIDFDRFRVYANPGIVENNPVELTSGVHTTKTMRTINISAVGKWFIKVQALDTFGNPSTFATYVFDMKPSLGARALTVVPGIDSVALGWQAPVDARTVTYDIREGASFSTSTLVIGEVKTLNSIVPFTDSDDKTFYVVAVDPFGNRSSEVISGTTKALKPDAATYFQVQPQGDDIQFKWRGTGQKVEWEVRLGISFESGTFVGRSAGENMTLLMPFSGELRFWIKSVSSVGLYSELALSDTTARAATVDRNVIVETDLKALGWPGMRYNFDIVDTNLKVIDINGAPAKLATYYYKNILPQEWHTRNFSQVSYEAFTNPFPSWDNANFSWDSAQAQVPWIGIADISGIQVLTQIAPMLTTYPANLIDGFRFNGTLYGLTAASSLTETIKPVYDDARFEDGLYVTDTTKVSWGISVPAQFSKTFDIRTKDALEGYCTFFVITNGTTRSLRVDYDHEFGKLHLIDQAGVKVTIDITLLPNNIYTIGINQTASTRTLRLKDVTNNTAIVKADASLAPLGTFNFLKLYAA